MARILIKGGCVLSMDQRVGNHYTADVLIDGATIAEIGPSVRARDAEIIDASDAIVMPGFVDAHRHACESLLRGLGDAGGTVGAASFGPHYTADDVYAATLIGLLGAAEAGITTVVDWCEIGASGGHADAALQAHTDVGLRTVFAHARASWAADDGEQWRSALRLLVAAERPPLVAIAAGLGELRRGDLDRWAGDWALARDLGLRVHAHAGATADGRGAVAELLGTGRLGPDVTLAHCATLSDADLDAVAAAGAMVTLTPSSEMAAGVQPLPVQKLIDRGIRPGLGVGSERLGPGDLFAQLRAVISMQHATHFDLKLAGKAGLPKLLTTREVIRYGTVDGARAAGLGDIVGTLAPGRQADLVVLRTDRPNIFPINDPIGAVVWGMDTSNIDWVLVAGRPVMRDGMLTADLDRARVLARAAQQRVTGTSGLQVATGTGSAS
jgi:5-methylthioadenosine/S-adenosylhomocysteine deaminase